MSYKLYNHLFKCVLKRLSVFTSTKEIDTYIKLIYERHGFYSAPYTKKFPGFSCISVNNTICHGIPNNKTINDKDVISIDISVYKKIGHNNTKLFYDSARSVVAFKKDTSPTEIYNNKFIKWIILLNRHHTLITIFFPKILYFETITNFTARFAQRNNLCVFEGYMGHHIGNELHMQPNVRYHNKESLQRSPVIRNRCFTHEPIFTIQKKILINLNQWMSKNISPCFCIENMYYVTKNGYLKRLTDFYSLPYYFLKS